MPLIVQTLLWLQLVDKGFVCKVADFNLRWVGFRWAGWDEVGGRGQQGGEWARWAGQ